MGTRKSAVIMGSLPYMPPTSGVGSFGLLLEGASVQNQKFSLKLKVSGAVPGPMFTPPSDQRPELKTTRLRSNRTPREGTKPASRVSCRMRIRLVASVRSP